ncbi:gas vesicle protein [Streptomyces wuyuanensis]|uniref:gas vesicle protein n=1 Tax=Streptomyces wuyuanensis TaxID=1196353 RepID=UPI003420C6FC
MTSATDPVLRGTSTPTGEGGPLAQRQLALVDLLDRLLAGGVVIKGDLTLRIADVDLVRVDLNALICSVGPVVASPFEDRFGSGPYEPRDDEPRGGTT